jgi:hypothetical protein
LLLKRQENDMTEQPSNDWLRQENNTPRQPSPEPDSPQPEPAPDEVPANPTPQEMPPRTPREIPQGRGPLRIYY